MFLFRRMVPAAVKAVVRRALRSRICPVSCSLFMTNRCNFSCRGCRRSVVGVSGAGDMGLGAVERLLEVYPTVKSFCLAGFGEPTLSPAFNEVADYLKEDGRCVEVVTNGIDAGRILSLKHEPDQVSVSLYGYDNESYKAACGVAVYDVVVKNFSAMRDRFSRVGFSYIVTRQNYRSLGEIVGLCDRLQPDFLHLHNYLAYNPNSSSEVEKIITVDDGEVIEYIDEVCSGSSYYILKPCYIDPAKPMHLCQSYNYTINLDGDGNIGGCQRQLPPDPSFGNIYRDRDPFRSEKMREHRGRMNRGGYAHDGCRFCFGNWKP